MVGGGEGGGGGFIDSSGGHTCSFLGSSNVFLMSFGMTGVLFDAMSLEEKLKFITNFCN